MFQIGTIASGILGGLFVVSEALGFSEKSAANGIVHAAYLFFQHLDKHQTIDERAVVDSLEEMLIDEVHESEART